MRKARAGGGYNYTVEYCLAITKKEIMPCAATWIDLEMVILSEISQRRRKEAREGMSKKVWHPLYARSKMK